VSTQPAQTVELEEVAARRLLLVRACEGPAVPGSLWSAEDRAWATRLAIQTLPADAGAAAFLGERARHACERLRPRDAGVAAVLALRAWRPAWAALALAAGLLTGLLVDSLGPATWINLLAPPVWAVVLWNLGVYALLATQVLHGGGPAMPNWLRRGLAVLPAWRRVADGPLAAWGPQWLRHTAPRHGARAAQLLHLAAGGLALGLMAGLYLRGLVWDYRVGWQSTFLESSAVRWVLGALLAPASTFTGIDLPGVDELARLRLGPGVEATASAAPWIHLYAATLLLAVVLPRGLLAGWAAWRGARPVRVSLADPYYQRLLAEWRQTPARVQLLSHGAAPTAQAALALRQVLAGALGDGVEIRVAPVISHGSEEEVPPAEPGTTLKLLLVDLAATPEAEAHGRILAAAQPGGVPLLLLTDEAEFRRRFVGLPQRLQERRAAWQALARSHGVPWVAADLHSPDIADAVAEVEAALSR
jgi:hypothetical protein